MQPAGLHGAPTPYALALPNPRTAHTSVWQVHRRVQDGVHLRGQVRAQAHDGARALLCDRRVQVSAGTVGAPPPWAIAPGPAPPAPHARPPGGTAARVRRRSRRRDCAHHAHPRLHTRLPGLPAPCPGSTLRSTAARCTSRPRATCRSSRCVPKRRLAKACRSGQSRRPLSAARTRRQAHALSQTGPTPRWLRRRAPVAAAPSPGDNCCLRLPSPPRNHPLTAPAAPAGLQGAVHAQVVLHARACRVHPGGAPEDGGGQGGREQDEGGAGHQEPGAGVGSVCGTGDGPRRPRHRPLPPLPRGPAARSGRPASLRAGGAGA